MKRVSFINNYLISKCLLEIHNIKMFIGHNINFKTINLI